MNIPNLVEITNPLRFYAIIWKESTTLSTDALPAFDPSHESYVLSHAYAPEHIPASMVTVSRARPFLIDDYLGPEIPPSLAHSCRSLGFPHIPGLTQPFLDDGFTVTRVSA